MLDHWNFEFYDERKRTSLPESGVVLWQKTRVKNARIPPVIARPKKTASIAASIARMPKERMFRK
jgi:hypothetical protein